MAPLRNRLQDTPRGRALQRLFYSTGESLTLTLIVAYLAILAMLVLALISLGAFVASDYTIARVGLLLDLVSGFSVIALSYVVLRAEQRRDRASFIIDEVTIHGPPEQHNPDEFTVACRIINAGGTPSVIWGKESWIRAHDRLGSRIRMPVTWWPAHRFLPATNHPHANQDTIVPRGGKGDFVGQVQLPYAVDAAGSKLVMVLTPAIGPRTTKEFAVPDLQTWLAPVRQRRPRPPRH